MSKLRFCTQCWRETSHYGMLFKRCVNCRCLNVSFLFWSGFIFIVSLIVMWLIAIFNEGVL